MTPNLAILFQGNGLDDTRHVLGSVIGALKDDPQFSIPLSLPLGNTFPLPKGSPTCLSFGLSACQTHPHVLAHRTSSAHRQKGSSKEVRASPPEKPYPTKEKRHWPPFSILRSHTAGTHLTPTRGMGRQICNGLLLL